MLMASPSIKQATKMEERIEALEIKLMEMELTVNELNDVVTNQYRLIDKLNKANIELNNKFASMAESGTTDVRDEPPPPHY